MVHHCSWNGKGVGKDKLWAMLRPAISGCTRTSSKGLPSTMLSTIVSADLSFSIQSSSLSERCVRRLLCPLVQQLQRVVALLPDCVKSVIAQGQADWEIFSGRMVLNHV